MHGDAYERQLQVCAALLVFSSAVTAQTIAPLAAPVTQATTQVRSRPPTIPAAVFANRPAYTDLVLSPDGGSVISTTVANGKEGIVIHDLASGRGRLLPPPTGELVGYRWAGNKRILITVGWTNPRRGDEVYATRLFVYDLAENRIQLIGKKDGGLEGDDVLYVDPKGSWLLLAFQKSLFEYPAVYRVDLTTTNLQLVNKAQDHVWEWYADDAGVVRAGIGFLRNSWFMVYRKPGEEEFHRLGTARYDDKAALDIVRLTGIPTTVSSCQTKRRAATHCIGSTSPRRCSDPLSLKVRPTIWTITTSAATARASSA